MSLEREFRFLSWNNPFIWGWGVTILVGLFFFVIGIHDNCNQPSNNTSNCASNFEHILSRPLNEIGDSLAGFAGTLAFVWLFVATWLQSQELQEQRRELRDARSEAKAMRLASEAMAQSLNSQAEALQDERRRRDFDATTRYINEMIASILTAFTSPRIKDAEIILSRLTPGTTVKLHFATTKLGISDADTAILNLTRHYTITSELINRERDLSVITSVRSIDFLDDLNAALIKCRAILGSSHQGDSIIMERVNRLSISTLQACLENIVSFVESFQTDSAESS